MLKRVAVAIGMIAGCGAALADDCVSLHGDAKIAACSEAIRANPQDAYAYHNRGVAALLDYDRAVDLGGGGDNYIDRGDFYRKQGDLDRALADYTMAIEAYGKQAQRNDDRASPAGQERARELANVMASAHIIRGRIHAERKDVDAALADIAKAIELSPSSAASYNERCWLRATANRDLPLALADCDKAIRLRPDDGNSLDSRGLVFLRLDRFDEAIADYDKALKIDPKAPSSLYGRGLAKLKKSDRGGGDGDIAAARAIKADIADEFAGYGVR